MTALSQRPTPGTLGRHLRATLLISGLSVGLVVVSVIAAGMGAYPIPAGQVAASLLDAVGVRIGALPDQIARTVLWDVRLPRLVLAVMVSAALGSAGAMTQGIFGNAIAGAAIGLMTNFSQDAEIQTITFWQLGSVSTATWSKVAAIVPCLLLGLGVIPFYARRLDLLALGEGPARHLGVDVERMRLVLITAMALLTSAVVAFAGIVAFVGPVVPHIIRMVTGPGHRVLLPASALGGGLLLLDEPTAALDIRHQELVLGIARTLASHGGAVIVVLHDLGLAAAYAHRVAVLSGGRVAAQGTPADVFTASSLSAVYRHEVEVLPHPRTGVPLVVPLRSPGCTRKRPQE